MSRYFRIQALLVGLLIGLCTAQTATAQPMSLVWKQWNWSILYPVDRASSIATQALLVSLGPSGALQPKYLNSIKLCSGLVSRRVFDKVWGGRWLSKFVREIRGKAERLGRYFSIESEKLGPLWDLVESEFSQAAERIECFAAARRDVESRRRELEYWRYYEDCDRWMPGFWMVDGDRPPDENRLSSRATFLEDAVALSIRRVVSSARWVTVAAGENAAYTAERCAQRSLQWAGCPAKQRHSMELASFKLAQAASRLTMHVTANVGSWVSQWFGRTQQVLAVIPVEAIGFVLPD